MNSGRKSGADEQRPSGEALGADLARWVRPDAESVPDLSELEKSLDAELEKERGPSAFLRSRTTPERVGLVGASLLLLLLLTLFVRARPDLSVYPLPRMLLLVGVLAAWFLGCLWLALWPLYWPAPPAAARRAVVACAPAAMGLLYSLPTAHTAHPRSIQAEGPLLARAFPCLIVGLLVASGIYLLLRAVDRGGTRVTWLMATAGGVAANLLLQLHCPVTAPEHLLLSHLGAALLMLGCVALLERILRR